MRRIILAILIVLSCVSFAECAGKFASFPTIGVCTGDSVNYRAQPGTKAEIWGKFNKNTKVIVDSRKVVDGETWYEVYPPNAQDTAYVHGKYLVPYFDEEAQKSPVNKTVIKILLTYCPYRDYDYWGEYDGEFDYPEVTRTYNKQGWLMGVEAWNPSKDFGFGDIHIGDDAGKLTKILGEPDKKSGSEYEYTAGTSSLTFRIENGKITRMIYEDKEN